MSTLVLRSVKGTPLTNTEVDNNFTNLNTDKLELGGTYSSGMANSVLYLNGSKVLTSGSALTFDGTTLGTTGALRVDGNTTLGDASTDTVTVNGYMGVGGAASNAAGIKVASTALTGIRQYGVHSAPVGTSAATTSIRSFLSDPSTAAASFTSSLVSGFHANDAAKGAGSVIDNLHGLYVADQTAGTNNYGITSLVSSGTNKWNIYASGTAANYFAGNVGIGTNSIGTGVTFHVSGTSRIANSSGGALQLEDTTVADNSLPFWVLQSDEGVFRLLSANRSGTGTTGSTTRFSTSIVESVFNDTGADIDFRVESDTNTHALFVQGSDGNVGIGTSSPGQKLEVGGATYVRSVVRSSATGATAGDAKLYLVGTRNTTGTSLGTVDFYNQTTGSDVLAAQVAAFSDGSGTGGYLTLATQAVGGVSTERLRITSDGYLRMASGSLGIQFNGDTAAANALDDYEEGTFSAVIEGTTTAGSGTYSVQQAKYTKIGNLVTVAISLVWSAHTGTGNMRIAGLPFTAAANQNPVAAVYANNLTVTGKVTATVQALQTIMSLFAENNGASTSIAMDTAGTIILSVSYFV